MKENKKDAFCDFKDIKIEDFEMIVYNPIKPQLKFELGI